VENRYQADLVFVAGPNACPSRGGSGSMDRTANVRANRDYKFFTSCIAHALAAGLDQMIDRGVNIALVARLSTGVYAGPWRQRIQRDFAGILDDVLRAPHPRVFIPRYTLFDEVVVPMLVDKVSQSEKRKRAATAASERTNTVKKLKEDNTNTATTTTTTTTTTTASDAENETLWACSTCTFINENPLGLACKMCSTERTNNNK